MDSKIKLNDDGQPINSAFNFSHNRDKSAYALRGILQGIITDKKLNDIELLFLDNWMKTQEHLDADGDVIDLLDAIGDILEDSYISTDELEQLNTLIADIIKFGKQTSEEMEDSINELIGLLLGISVDGKISDDEFEYLDNWLINNSHIDNTWPANILMGRIRDIKEDGVIDAEEKRELLETLKQISGQRFDETGSADGAVAEVFSDQITEFYHLNKKICFTGKFICGTRNVCENSAKRKGAIISKSVTTDLDVLILGTLASRDWRFTSHGRKIEKALGYKNKGRDILILSERTWLKFV